ncbi:MAG TPA: adenylate kinase [Jiangellaceae bacterium]
MKRLLLMGSPGSGKGTQAAIVSARLGISAISTGDIFRANVAGGTPLGIEAKKYISRGEFVPDSVTNAMVAARLSRPDAATGFILDGYPRTVAQVDFLDGVLAAQSAKLDCVISLTVDVEEVVKRLLRRAEAEGRSDDTEEVIRHRLELFAEQTAPLAEIYQDRGLLTRINGMGPVAEVATRMLAVIADDDEPTVADPAGDPAQRA